MKRTATTSLVIGLLALAASRTTEARLWRVELDGSGDFTDIQPAVDAAAAGDTISIGPGRFDTFRPCVAPGWTEQTVVWITENDLTFIGSGPEATIIGPATRAAAPGGASKGFCQFGEHSGRIEQLSIENVFQGIYWWHGFMTVEYCVLKARIGAWTEGGRIGNCRFETGGGFGGCSVTNDIGTLTIADSVFDGSGPAIHVIGGFGQVAIRGCEFRNPRHGIDVEQLGTAVVEDCVIDDAWEEGLAVIWGSSGTVGRTAIHHAVTGVLVDGNSSSIVGSSMEIDGSTRAALDLTSNVRVSISGSHILPASGLAVQCLGRWTSVPVISMAGNYWGTTDPAVIDAAIWDGNDDPSLGCMVAYVPFAGGPLPTETKTWGDLKALFR